jgi:hypothetical protein
MVGSTPTTKALLPVFPDLTEEERWRSTFALIPPTLCLGTAPDQAFYFIVTPKTAETIDVEIGYLLHPSALEHPMFEHLFAMSDAGVQVFVRQDQDATTKVQRGMHFALRRPRSILVARESHVQFNRWLVQRYRSTGLHPDISVRSGRFAACPRYWGCLTVIARDCERSDNGAISATADEHRSKIWAPRAHVENVDISHPSRGRCLTVSLGQMRILVSSTPGMGHLTCLLPLGIGAARRRARRAVRAPRQSRARWLPVRVRGAPAGMAPAERRAALAPRQAEVMDACRRADAAGLLFSIMFAGAAAPAMRIELAPIMDEFVPDVVLHETGELAAAPLAKARDIPSVTVAFSGAVPEWSHEMVLASLAPLWADEGLPPPTLPRRLRRPVPPPVSAPSFDQAPPVRGVAAMRPTAVWSAADAAPTWLAELGRLAARLPDLRHRARRSAGTVDGRTRSLGDLDVEAVATIGRHIDPSTFGPIPSNVRVERFVPQQFVLDRAALVMSHAGAGSLLGATATGVPQLLNPIWADQWENADAASGAGVAVTCELEQRSASDIAAALQRLLDDGRFSDAASRVADRSCGDAGTRRPRGDDRSSRERCVVSDDAAWVVLRRL